MKSLLCFLVLFLILALANGQQEQDQAAIPMPVDSESELSLRQRLNVFLPRVFGSGTTNNDSCTQSCCASLKSRASQTYHYYQNTGHFKGGSGEWAVSTKCYAGQGEGKNNPAKQCVSNTGPLPATTYKLASCVNVMHSTVQRPCSFYLQPQKQSQMCGRSAFFIHGCTCCTTGDDTQPPSAGCSAGCIVMSYANRRKLRVGDTLIVEHYEPKAEENVVVEESQEHKE